MRLWKELFLVDSPLHQQMEILKHINQINDQSERLIAATTANIQEGTKIWIEKWLNAKNIEEFESSATEVAKFSPKFCEFHSNVTYKTLTPAASPVVDSSYNGSFDSSFALETLVSDQVNFVQVLAGISERLRHVQPVEKRGKKLEKELEHLNSTLSSSALYPLCTASDDLFKVVRIPPQEGKVFSTKMRAPTLIFLETIPVDVSSYLMEDKLCAFAGSNRHGGPLYRDELMDSLEVQEMDEEANSDLISDSNTLRDSIGSEISSTSHSEAFRLWQSELNDQVEGGLLDMGFADKRKQQELILHGKLQCSLLPLSETMAILEDKVPATISHTFSKHAHYQAEVHGHQVDNLVYESKVYGESWEERCERIRLSSPMGHLPGWKLFSIIVKTNDDLRQEMFAMQMINKFKMIFDTKRLDLWLRPYRIVATGANIGILETINDACSLDHLKKNAENPNLLAYFKLVYGNNGTDDRKFLEAQKNFISSMAAYSIVSYVLLVKDRHNGNLLLGSEGHLIHIDFGFILGIAPGGMFSIEDAPFKLTSEMVDVMGGIDSTGFKRFQKLICSGLIALQRYETEISALLQTTGQNSPFPCFVHAKVPCMIKELRERLCVGLTRAQVEKKVEQLIRKSYNAWGTRHYDAFQQRSNNIHP
jgi:phosphatidylinositol 4-kinase